MMRSTSFSPAAQALLARERGGGQGFEERGLSDLDQLASLSRTPADWHRRAGELRDGMMRGLGLTTLSPALAPQVRSRSVRNATHCEIESFSLVVAPGLHVAGNLYRPRQSTGPLPVALLPHGHGEGGRFNENQQQLAATLARLGVLAVTYDMQGHGESDQMLHDWQHMAALQTWQSVRVLDYLLAIPGVDRSRVLVSGHSGGATQSIYLTALDDRVSMSIPVVMVSSAFYGGCQCESGLPIHQGSRDAGGHATNNAEIAALASISRQGTARPMLIVSIDGDWTAMTPYREFPFIARVYEMLGAGSLVENRHLHEPDHDYGATKRLATYRFVAQHWGLDLGRIADRSGAVTDCGPVLPRHDLFFHADGSARQELGAANPADVLAWLEGRA